MTSYIHLCLWVIWVANLKLPGDELNKIVNSKYSSPQYLALLD